MFHKYLGFNRFTKQVYPIPPKTEGWKKIPRKDCEAIRQHAVDPEAIVFSPQTIDPIAKEHIGWKVYDTQDNGGIGFRVWLSSDKGEYEGMYCAQRNSCVKRVSRTKIRSLHKKGKK